MKRADTRPSDAASADNGAHDAEKTARKAKIAAAIEARIQDKDLTQREASAVTGIPQPRLSALRNGRFHGISETRMLEALRALGNDVEVVIRPPRSKSRPGQMTVTFATDDPEDA